MSSVKKLSTALICMCVSAVAQLGPEAITSPIPNPIPYPFPINLGPWNNFQLSGPGSIAPTGRIAALSRNPSTMEVFWIGSDGSVQDRYYYDGSGWNGFTLAGAGSASKTGGIAADRECSTRWKCFGRALMAPCRIAIITMAPDGTASP
jgi:hypothetical protein